MTRCKHCGQERYVRARGLCYPCYSDQDIKSLYPRAKSGAGVEPTADEVRALIEEARAKGLIRQPPERDLS